ncbi:MAG: ABC transporter ATP-binding protein/permease [Oscillospiraceae bacterium]|nr:ABC transporter ATP-binding protein/permease [Oscillospiraceae bacterium]
MAQNNQFQGKPPRGARVPMKFDKKTIRRVMSYMKPYKVQMIAVLVCIIITAVASVSSSLFLGSLIDDHIEPMVKNKSSDYSGLLRSLIMMGCLFLGGALSALINARIMATVSQGILKTIRRDMFNHMQTLPISYFDTHPHGDVMSFYTNDADAMQQMLSQAVPQVLSSGITIIAVFCSMLSISVWLTLTVIVFLAFMLMITAKLAGKSGKFFVRQQGSLAKINGYIEEMINGQRVIKIFCREDKSKEAFDGKNHDLCENTCSANAYANILMPVNNCLGYLLYVVLAIVGGSLAINKVPNVSCFAVGILSLGNIASFLQLSRSFIGPIGQVSQQLNSVVMALAGAERIFTLIDEKPETDDGFVTLVNAKKDADGNITETEEKTGLRAWKIPSDTGITTYVEHRGDIVLDNVDFGYVPEKTVLHDIDIFAEPGQKIAFVGATGAGKTTITNLINRFYDIADGKIRYDGININKIKKADLRRSLGVVLQDVNLFTGTIMDNLRYGSPDATDEECIAAAKLANADTFIRMLPDGYQTVLHGSGSSLSQGQRQLLSIARAAVADPPVMILDEATSSIDTRTETIVQAGMDALMKGRTVFVIAHRLSTVKNSDVIMVLDHGHIIERGSHDKLIAEKGQYYRLYTGAFELE